jgi:hypothetical protein
VNPSFVLSNWKYNPDHGELAQPKATTVQMSSRMLPVASDW